MVTSDGTSELVRRDPVTLEPREVVQVRCQGQRVLGLNDLTWAGGLVWANVAGTDCLAGIDLGVRRDHRRGRRPRGGRAALG